MGTECFTCSRQRGGVADGTGVAAQETSYPAVTTGTVHLAEHETGGQAGSQAKQRTGQHLTAGIALNPSCDRELHSVNLIPLHTSENRARTMSQAPVTRGMLPVARLVLLAIVVLAGLGLFLWLSRSTPVVVQPAGVETRP